jgi:class 3 adenylate cyclase
MHAARSTLASRLATVGLPALDYGIGIQTGSVVSAVMGSAIRRQYGLVGTTVVLGARLCSAAGAGDVVISDATWHALDDPPVAATETVALKGVDGPTTVHRIRRRTDQPTRADA